MGIPGQGPAMVHGAGCLISFFVLIWVMLFFVRMILIVEIWCVRPGCVDVLLHCVCG